MSDGDFSDEFRSGFWPLAEEVFFVGGSVAVWSEPVGPVVGEGEGGEEHQEGDRENTTQQVQTHRFERFISSAQSYLFRTLPAPNLSEQRKAVFGNSHIDFSPSIESLFIILYNVAGVTVITNLFYHAVSYKLL